jgi:hypothetical protein
VTVAALYVDPDGVYANLPDVEVWDEARDARKYVGPWPVVAHPPCTAWSLMSNCRPERPKGEDGYCFAAALAAVRRYGGVLEHPAHSAAFKRYGLPKPQGWGWSDIIGDCGSICAVDQRWFGHPARKPTWLYAHGVRLIPLPSGLGPRGKSIAKSHFGGVTDRSVTPEAFRDVLLAMARSAA